MATIRDNPRIATFPESENDWREFILNLYDLLPQKYEPVYTFTSGDATPSVKGGRLFETAGTTAITDFDDGIKGQTIVIHATASITITDGASVDLQGGANYDMTATDILVMTMFSDQVWTEICRSVNGG